MLLCNSHLIFLSLSRKRRKRQGGIWSYISNPGHPAIPLQERLKGGSQHPPVAWHTIWPTGHPANASGTSTGHCPIFPHPGAPLFLNIGNSLTPPPATGAPWMGTILGDLPPPPWRTHGSVPR